MLRRLVWASTALAAGLSWAGQAPLPPADEAPGPAQRLAPLEEDLQRESRRAAAALEALRHQQEALRDARAEEEAAVRRALDHAAALQVELGATTPADALYDEIVREIVVARQRLREALDAATEAPAVARFAAALDLDALRGSTLAGHLAELERQLAEIGGAEDELRRLERELRWERVERRWEVVGRLNALRIRTLDRLSGERHSQMLGLSRQGVRQLERELEQFLLSARAWALTRWHRLHELRHTLGDAFAVGAAAWAALKVLLVLLLYRALHGRGKRIAEGSRRAFLAVSGRVVWRRRFETLLQLGRVTVPWLFLLVALRALLWALGPAADWPEVRIAFRLAVLYALYRLSIDALVAGGRALARRYRLEAGPARMAKLLRSVRTVLRVVFAVLLLLALSSRFLGEGYLYHVVLRLALFAVAIALLVVFLRWRDDVVEAYLRRGRPGWLRQHVEQARERWYGGFVAAAALLSLAGSALVVLASEFALGFDQTRRALAFVFRRRIEKQAERTGYAEPAAVEHLAPVLQEVLTEEPVGADERLVVDHFPGLDRLHAALERWREHGTGGSFLVTGDRGVGRTSWLGRVRPDGLPVQRVTFDRRIDSPATLASVLGQALELGELESCRDLRLKLREGERRVVLVDRGQNLFLGRVGGYAGFEAFMSLVDNTAERVFWLVTFSQFAWEHVAAVHPQLAGFRGHQRLDAWPEERIRELIRRRVEASGVRVVYDDLVLGSLEGLSYRARALETEADYTRLLWDHSMGLPRVALQYWRRSLVPDGDTRVRVRLFRPAPAEQLEGGGDVPLFLLGAIVVHESLTVREMSVVTRYPEPLCRIHVARLEDLGVIRPAGIRYWVTSYWQPAVYRMLKRRNLLSD